MLLSRGTGFTDQLSELKNIVNHASHQEVDRDQDTEDMVFEH